MKKSPRQKRVGKGADERKTKRHRRPRHVVWGRGCSVHIVIRAPSEMTDYHAEGVKILA